MSEVIRVLQMGSEDWNQRYQVPDYVEVTYVENSPGETDSVDITEKDVYSRVPKNKYDLVCIEGRISDEAVRVLSKLVKAYTLFVTKETVLTEAMEELYACKKGRCIAAEEIENFLCNEAENYYAKPYGEKFKMPNIAIAQGFSGKVFWDGHYSVNVDGEYGDELSQIMYWRNNIPIMQGQAIDFWLEYEKDDDVEIALEVTVFQRGAISTVQQKWHFDGEAVKGIMVVDNQLPQGIAFLSLLAKGSGKLKVIALHDRYSRRGHGIFLPGGERYVTAKREEIFYYFDPGDRKAPLNVYFSGYKTLQGFEGYNMMRSMGCPFLLIAEPRLEGGCFYMGDEEYEKAFVEIIHKYMEELGFSNEQVILSGLSMGSFGALYYGCDILPYAMIVGKPLASIGDVAANERVHRPGGFPTSLDVLKYIACGTDRRAIDRLNHKFWDKFDRVDWGKSKFILSYMIEDDYDATAYDTLISHLHTAGVQVYGKGIHGRHNDATGDIVGWFRNQYNKILEEDFGRGKK